MDTLAPRLTVVGIATQLAAINALSAWELIVAPCLGNPGPVAGCQVLLSLANAVLAFVIARGLRRPAPPWQVLIWFGLGTVFVEFWGVVVSGALIDFDGKTLAALTGTPYGGFAIAGCGLWLRRKQRHQAPS